MKEFIRRIILQLGYEIRHKSVSPGDPFQQQRRLLSGIAAPVIFDVGANIGAVTERYRQLFRDAKIYAFEPFPVIFEQLERNVRHDKHVIPWMLALGNAQSKQALQVNASSPTNSLLETDESATSFWGKGRLETTEKVDVDVTTMDQFCSENQISHIDLLKLDTQGTERLILEGGRQMLSAGRVGVIYTEIIVAPSYVGQSKTHELLLLLDELGYVLYGLYNLWSLDGGRLLQMDGLFVRSDRLAGNTMICAIGGTDKSEVDRATI